MSLSPETIIESIITELGLKYEKEYEFARSQGRKWRADYCIPEIKTLLEIEGAVYSNHSRHTRGSGYSEDCIKYNSASILGWVLLRYTTDQIKKEPKRIYNDLLYVKERKAC